MKTGINVKVEHTNMGVTTTNSTIEDTGMLELFELCIDKVKCPLEIPESFDRNDELLDITKESMPMKDMPSLTKDKSMTPSDSTSFASIFSSLLTLPTNDDKHATKSRYKSVTSPLIHKFAENSRVYSEGRLIKSSIRHAMDKADPSVIDGNISVGSYNEEIVIVFDAKVKPSMIKGLCKKICVLIESTL